MVCYNFTDTVQASEIGNRLTDAFVCGMVEQSAMDTIIILLIMLTILIAIFVFVARRRRR